MTSLSEILDILSHMLLIVWNACLILFLAMIGTILFIGLFRFLAMQINKGINPRN